MHDRTAPLPLPTLGRVLLATAGMFALTTGAAVGGPLSQPINAATGLGVASIGLAFAFGQPWGACMATLFGIVILAHQTGGKAFQQSGSHD